MLENNNAEYIVKMLDLYKRMGQAETDQENLELMKEFRELLIEYKEDLQKAKEEKEKEDTPSFVEGLLKGKGLKDYGVNATHTTFPFPDMTLGNEDLDGDSFGKQYPDLSQIELQMFTKFPELEKELENQQKQADPFSEIIDRLLEVNDMFIDYIAPKEESEYLNFPADFKMPTDHAGTSTHVPSDEEVQEVVSELQDELVEEGDTVVVRRGTTTAIKLHDETGVHYIVADNPFYAHVEK